MRQALVNDIIMIVLPHQIPDIFMNQSYVHDSVLTVAFMDQASVHKPVDNTILIDSCTTVWCI